MAEIKTSPVTARLVSDIDSVRATAGAFEFYADGDRFPAGMIYSCPCGCGATGVLRFRPTPSPSPSWEWDGNRERPTLSPSVHHVGHWHGFLRNGVWESC
ncbi:hypothetical protein XM25_15165 [Devosia sp. H5989]|nr:hypothetical protein XM25_15165 [Devosia sp. H5989]